ncbi:MAG TPA: DUF1015 domain-containing protein [Terriglobales bacterium]|nr:DUF1015 domain-containing protein [Terriglobales bacterium]
MADIKPFRALRYDTNRVAPSDVVTQPYDKISPAMQDKYYAASPYNLVRIILGKSEPGDSDSGNVYTRAADSFQSWRKEGVLRPEARESFYYYTQRFTVPGTAVGAAGPVEFERRGFIALGRIHDYTDGDVFRHEQTLAKPKSDRLNLLRATRAHFGQIFMLYSDPAGDVDLLLENFTLAVSPGGTRQSEADAAMAVEPDIALTDEYGVLHRVWCISDPHVIKAVQDRMAGKKLIIADGHHRYETALNYRNESRLAGQSAGKGANAPHEFVMMTFVNMDSKGLVILPTHRVVHGLANFDREKFLESARKYFEVVPASGSCDQLANRLHEAGRHGTTLLANSGDACFLLHARPGAADSILKDVPALQRQLDVVHLHKVLLEHVLGLSEESIRNQENISYHRDASEALARVREGANVAFLMNPVKMDQLREITFAGGVLPQKSTDFYPKLLSGLTIYPLE